MKSVKVNDPAAEIARVAEALEASKQQLGILYEKALEELGEANAMIFSVHQMLLEDEAYLDSVYNIIREESANAEYAVKMTGDMYAEMFAGMDDEYMSARAADIRALLSPTFIACVVVFVIATFALKP